MSLRLSTAPHIRSPKTTTRLMLNVLLALLPSAAAGVWYFGTRALMLLCVSTASAVVAEYLWQKLGRLPVRVGDLSTLTLYEVFDANFLDSRVCNKCSLSVPLDSSNSVEKLCDSWV